MVWDTRTTKLLQICEQNRKGEDSGEVFQ